MRRKDITNKERAFLPKKKNDSLIPADFDAALTRRNCIKRLATGLVIMSFPIFIPDPRKSNANTYQTILMGILINLVSNAIWAVGERLFEDTSPKEGFYWKGSKCIGYGSCEKIFTGTIISAEIAAASCPVQAFNIPSSYVFQGSYW